MTKVLTVVEASAASDIRAQLLGLGYEPVGQATSGEQAVALAAQAQPDLVLMDIHLARAADGSSAAQLIRNRHSLPVVFLAEDARDEDLASAKLAEPLGYIVKPFSARELRTVLEMAVYKHRIDAQLRASERRFRTIFDAEPECVKVVAPDGRLLEMNAAGLAMLGARSVDEVRQLGLQSFVAPEYRAPFGALHQAVVNGQRGILEFEVTGLDGTRRRLETHAVPMQDPEHDRTLMLGVTRDITQRTLAEAALRENSRRMQALSRRVLEVQEAERRGLAHELHESLGQTLVAIKINLQSAGLFKGAEAEAMQAQNLRSMDAALQQVRRMALALRPPMLDDLGLSASLRWIAGQAAALGGFALQLELAIEQARLAPEIEIACFRIAQEALANVVQHAAAKLVTLKLHRDGNTLVLEVRDDGCGFDPLVQRERALAGEGVGLLGMHERAALIGGQLDVQSAPARGSGLQLRCPWRVPAPSPDGV